MSKSILGQSISNDKSNDNQVIPGFWHRDWTNSTRRCGSTLGSNDSRQSQRYTFKPKDFVNATNTIVYIQSYITKEPSNQVVWCIRCIPAPGGVLPYITYTGMCRPKGLWFWSSWFRTGYPFQRRFLERGIIFRTHESSNFVSSHLKVFKDRLLLKIRFNALTSKLLYSCCTLERSIKIGPFLQRGISFRVNSRTGYKKLTHF